MHCSKLTPHVARCAAPWRCWSASWRTVTKGKESIGEVATWKYQSPACRFFSKSIGQGKLPPAYPKLVRAATSSSQSGNASGATGRLKLEKVQVGVLDRWLTIVQPNDLDAVLDMYVEQGRLDRDPYWCRLWASAIALSEELLEMPEVVAGKLVCDLGAGLGLAGLSSALSGAREVILYDREPLALHCALMTAAANGIPVGPYGNFAPFLLFSDSLPVPVQPSTLEDLDLTSAAPRQPLPTARLENAYIGAGPALKGAIARSVGSPGEGWTEVVPVPKRVQLRAELFDWSDEEFRHPPFDVVLACDVLYESYSVANVARVIARMLRSRPGSCAVIADPTYRSPANRETFIKLMATKYQFKLERSDQREPIVDGGAQSVEIMHFVAQP